MWRSDAEVLEGGRTRKISLLSDGKTLCYGDVLDLWQSEQGFRSFFISLLADAPFAAYFWETPPVTETSLEQAFEFVLVDGPQLVGLSSDQSAFREHFTSADVGEEIVTFANLGKDAVLIAPRPRVSLFAYPHIAVFAREAPEAQNHALWERVGAVLEQRLCQHPIWLSTAGLGVPWLHVRLDSRPKYYNFQPYRELQWP